MKVEDFVFVGFHSRVAALDRQTGDIVWKWKASSGSGFVSLLLDGDRLIVAVQGYTYCLDPATGQQLWLNPMKGFGIGITSLAGSTGQSSSALLAQAAARHAAAAAGGGAAAAAAGGAAAAGA